MRVAFRLRILFYLSADSLLSELGGGVKSPLDSSRVGDDSDVLACEREIKREISIIIFNCC